MHTPSKRSGILAALAIAFFLAQDASAAPARNTLGVASDLSRVGWAKKANSIDCKFDDVAYKAKKRDSLSIAAPIEARTSAVEVVKVIKVNETPSVYNVNVDICSQFYLEPPCTPVVLLPGSCAKVPPNLRFSSMGYGPGVTCRLYTGTMCGGQGTPKGEMVTVPYDATSDLSRVGWNKKANSFDCQDSSDHPAPDALSAHLTVPRAVTFAHHRNRDLMRITLYDKILFEDDNTPGSGYEFAMEPDLCIKLRDVNFERKTSSINFERGPVCTFFENGDCDGGPTLILAVPETNLRPFHTDDWKTWNDRISSFSCRWKNAIKAREVAPNEVSVAHTPADEYIKVILWTDIGFGGDSNDWSLAPGACAELMGTNKDTVISSVEFERGQTCTFFETPDCNNIIGGEDSPTLVLKFGETNLSAFHTDDWKTWSDRIGSFKCVWNK